MLTKNGVTQSVPVEEHDYIVEFCRTLEAVCLVHKVAPGYLFQGKTRKDARIVAARDELIDSLQHSPTLHFTYAALARYFGLSHSTLIKGKKRRENGHVSSS